MASLFIGPFFPYLEQRLAEGLAQVKQNDPFEPVAVVVPTRALKRRLQSLLAARGPWVNVDFFTFFTFALSVLKAARREIRPIAPEAIFPLLLKEAVESDLPRNEYTAYFLSFRNSLTRLVALFSRFTSYRVTPPARLAGIEKTLFSIYRSFRDLRRDRDVYDADDLIGQAADVLATDIPPGVLPTIFLYGFYDLNPVQKEIVRLLDERGDLTVLSPGGFSAGAEEFFRETAAFYRSLCVAADTIGGPLPADPEPVILSIARELFSTPDRPHRDSGGRIKLLTASGTNGEARAVALEILRLREQDPTLEWHDISVTMRERGDFAGALTDAFTEFSIPAIFDGGQPLSSMPEVGYFLVLMSALERGLPRDDVTFLVSSALFAWPTLPAGDEHWMRENAYLLTAFAKRYRIILGKREWESAFTEHRNRPVDTDLSTEEREETPDDELDRSVARYIQAAQPIIGQFLSALSDIPAEAPPSEYHRLLTYVITTYIRTAFDGSSGVEYLKEIANMLTAISSISHSITLNDCISILRDMISEKTVPSPEDRDGIFVSDVMGARGLPRKVLFLMGMNEKTFPRVPTRDPFLSDETGRTMGLPTAAARLLEDRALFTLTVGSAQDLLVITRQRSDEAGRTLSPSPFLTELVSRITIDGAAVALESSLSQPTGRDYPRITAMDGDLARYRAQDARTFLCLRWPADNYLRAARGVVSGTPFLRAGLGTLEERAPDRPFSRYDGLIGPAAGLARAIAPLSSQRLETYASCPFDFFMHYILSARQQEAVEEELDVESREIGLLYHRILSRIVPLVVQKGLFASSTQDPEPIDDLIKAHVKKEISARLSGRIPALILRAREEHTALVMVRLIRREREKGASGFIPALYEVTFGDEGDGPSENPALTLAIGGRPFQFIGRIDRIDINESDAAFAVTDYKKRKSAGARKLKTDIMAGRHFQLPIYLMAAEALVLKKKYHPAAGALVYLEADEETDYRETLSGDEYEETRAAAFERIGGIIDAMLAGEFTPSRGNSCRFCTYRDLCRSDIRAIGAVRREKAADGSAWEGEEGTDHEA